MNATIIELAAAQPVHLNPFTIGPPKLAPAPLRLVHESLE